MDTKKERRNSFSKKVTSIIPIVQILTIFSVYTCSTTNSTLHLDFFPMLQLPSFLSEDKPFKLDDDHYMYLMTT